MGLNANVVKGLEECLSFNEEAKKLRHKANEIKFEARIREREAFENIFREKGIRFNCTVVKSKETGTLGVVSLLDGEYSGRALFYCVEFFPLKKNGEVRQARSRSDSPCFGMAVAFNPTDGTHTYKGSTSELACELFPEYVDKVVSESEVTAMYITGIAEQFEPMGYTVCENKAVAGNKQTCSLYPCSLKEGEKE